MLAKVFLPSYTRTWIRSVCQMSCYPSTTLASHLRCINHFMAIDFVVIPISIGLPYCLPVSSAFPFDFEWSSSQLSTAWSASALSEYQNPRFSMFGFIVLLSLLMDNWSKLWISCLSLDLSESSNWAKRCAICSIFSCVIPLLFVVSLVVWRKLICSAENEIKHSWQDALVVNWKMGVRSFVNHPEYSIFNDRFA